MLGLGLALTALSIYMVIRPDTSWKWLIGITDGILIAFCGWMILRSGRRRAEAASPVTEEEAPEPLRLYSVPGSGEIYGADGHYGDSLAAADGSHALVGAGLDRHRCAKYVLQAGADRRLVEAKLRLLTDDRYVDVDGRAA